MLKAFHSLFECIYFNNAYVMNCMTFGGSCWLKKWQFKLDTGSKEGLHNNIRKMVILVIGDVYLYLMILLVSSGFLKICLCALCLIKYTL